MSWSPEHKAQTRSKILKSASHLFTHHGFDKVSIDQVMQDAGMTRGAFYKHFSSKSELYSEAIIYGATQGAGRNLSTATDIAQVIERYLSLHHLQPEKDACPLAFLVSDITQREPLQQKTYAKVLQGFTRFLEQKSGKSREQAVLATVLMIGGVALARAAGDETLAGEIIQTARVEAQQQLGCMAENKAGS
ncbi:TetR/AcrR family transcriptional regulator [Oceanospirillum linum]|uniref:HTH tetR-type domain-containing protein n=1 Tax=Oceanospirillum linum TaxID=966 RepID=A0A1T1H8B7_OCELI|nr:TetR/AcrR family transcriptional regulator [Oceanospirillum linum]OOV85957.1 hypothetical protein BTA35_0215720 [Oceanospirillum linum]SEG45126.1 DNA-binding transcriptional regulator, AcrR family [Oleiphilus messinensis]SMP34505.1 transcriptional regulator, TetR family [Oceanospirillum linum]